MITKIKNKNGKIFYYEEYDDYETIPEMVDKNKNNIEYLKSIAPEELKPLIKENERNISINTNDIADTQIKVNNKQNILIAGDNISIIGDTISAAGGGIGDTINSSKVIDDKSSKPTEGINPLLNAINTKQNNLIAGTNIKIVGDTISATDGREENWEVISTTYTTNEIKFSESLYLFSKISIVGQVKLLSNPYQLYLNFNGINIDELIAEKTVLSCTTEEIYIIGKGELVMWDDLLSFEYFNIQTGKVETNRIESIKNLVVKGIRK